MIMMFEPEKWCFISSGRCSSAFLNDTVPLRAVTTTKRWSFCMLSAMCGISFQWVISVNEQRMVGW